MNDKHYFSDITELFLRAKKEEQIEVNPQIKNAVREMLKYKISEIKGTKNIAQDKPDIFGFFRKWRYQLVAVPASLATLIIVVFAASNLRLTIPKEDLATDIQQADKIAQTEIDKSYSLIADLEAEDEIDPTETDRALLQTVSKPDNKPLSINVNDKTTTRTLNKIPQTGRENYIADNTPDVPDSKELLSSEAILDFDFILPKTESAEKSSDDVVEKPQETLPGESSDEPTKEVADEPTSEPETYIASIDEEDTRSAEEIVADEAVQEEATEPKAEFTTSSMIAVLPEEEQTLKRIYTEKEQIFVKQTREESYPVYYFRNSSVDIAPKFDESLLKNISEKSLPSSMTVYYTDDDKVLVEMALKEDSATKWYLFEKVNDTWTIQKYEKEIVNDVVK